jgi:hypothetical protein
MKNPFMDTANQDWLRIGRKRPNLWILVFFKRFTLKVLANSINIIKTIIVIAVARINSIMIFFVEGRF